MEQAVSKIVAFCGERKSGKDFFCEHLERVEEGVQRLSFSDEVRRLVLTASGGPFRGRPRVACSAAV